MKQPEQMDDEELAVAVATEVLGWEFAKGDQFSSAHVVEPKGDLRLRHNIEGPLVTRILSPEGREAIENELEERGFDVQLTVSNDLLWPDKDFYASADISGPITEANWEGAVDSYTWSCKCKHHALAVAALKAVRGGG